MSWLIMAASQNSSSRKPTNRAVSWLKRRNNAGTSGLSTTAGVEGCELRIR